MRKNAKGEWGNTTWFLHPISKIIQPRGQRVTCSKLFPQQWKLGNGDYLCKAGRDILPCKPPEILKPDSSSLHDQLDRSFHLHMGHGITSTVEMKANSLRANEGSYQVRIFLSHPLIKKSNVFQHSFFAFFCRETYKQSYCSGIMKT